MDDVNGVFHSFLILYFFKEKKLCSNEQLCTYWKKSLFSSRRKGCGYSSWWITIKFDFVRVKPSMNCLLAPARLVIRVTINKLYLEWLMSGVVGMLWNGEGLGTGESNVSIVLLNSVLHRFSSLSDVHLATFTWNPVNYAILFSRVVSVDRDGGREIPEAWMPTIKKHSNRRAVRQWTAEGANHWVNSKDRNAPIRAVEKQLITAEHHALQDHAWPVDLIAWRRLAVYSRNVAIYITRDYIVKQTKNLAFIVFIAHAFVKLHQELFTS